MYPIKLFKFECVCVCVCVSRGWCVCVNRWVGVIDYNLKGTECFCSVLTRQKNILLHITSPVEICIYCIYAYIKTLICFVEFLMHLSNNWLQLHYFN